MNFTKAQAEIIVDRVLNKITPAVFALEEVIDTGKTTVHHARMAYEELIRLVEWVRKIEDESR